jgi:hypothetical protein
VSAAAARLLFPLGRMLHLDLAVQPLGCCLWLGRLRVDTWQCLWALAHSMQLSSESALLSTKYDGMARAVPAVPNTHLTLPWQGYLRTQMLTDRVRSLSDRRVCCSACSTEGHAPSRSASSRSRGQAAAASGLQPLGHCAPA